MKKWRCTVCNYIHEGDTPPDKCPVCGVGPDKFVLLEEVAGDMDQEEKNRLQGLLFNVSYGLYIIGSVDEDKLNAMTSNTFIQVSNEPLRASVCLGKQNLTAEYVRKSGVFSASVLGQNNQELVKHFGYQSGRNVDKFKGMSYITGEKTGCPGILNTICFLECEVEQIVDLETHYMFIGKVLNGEKFEKDDPMTYAYYRAMRR